LEWCHDALDDLDWTFDRLCLGDHYPGIRLGAGWPLHPIGAGLRALSGRDAPAGALTAVAQPRVSALASLLPQFLPIALPSRARTCYSGPADREESRHG